MDHNVHFSPKKIMCTNICCAHKHIWPKSTTPEKQNVEVSKKIKHVEENEIWFKQLLHDLDNVEQNIDKSLNKWKEEVEEWTLQKIISKLGILLPTIHESFHDTVIKELFGMLNYSVQKLPIKHSFGVSETNCVISTINTPNFIESREGNNKVVKLTSFSQNLLAKIDQDVSLANIENMYHYEKPSKSN